MIKINTEVINVNTEVIKVNTDVIKVNTEVIHINGTSCIKPADILVSTKCNYT
jgi:hypothetical protein